MALQPLTPLQPATSSPLSSTRIDASIQPVCLEELTPLQRRSLDSAVMMLVNYLVAASAEK